MSENKRKTFRVQLTYNTYLYYNGYHNIVYEINHARRIAFRFERLAAGHLRAVFDFWKNCITNSRHVIDLILTRVIRRPSYLCVFGRLFFHIFTSTHTTHSDYIARL